MKNTISLFDVYDIPKPQKTETYTPVSNQILIETIKEKLYKNNMELVTERYTTNKTKSQLFGVMEVKQGNNEQLLNFGFRNSYDKSLAVGMVAGSTVIVCSNLMFKGNIKVMRKHTNGVFNDLQNLVNDVVDIGYEELESIIKDSTHLKNIEINRKEMAQIAGDMFINHNIVNSTQINILKREIEQSQKFKNLTMWDFYNHCTEALKASAPAEVVQNHINLHKHVLSL